MADEAGGDDPLQKVAVKRVSFPYTTLLSARQVKSAMPVRKIGESDSGATLQADTDGALSDPEEVHAKMTFSREELDAKLAANEARLETIETRVDARIVSELSRLEKQIEAGFSEQRAINARIETTLAHTATARGLIATVFSGAVGVFVALLSVMALAGNRFDAGMNLVGSTVHDIEMLKQKQAETDKTILAMQDTSSRQMTALSDKLDVIIKTLPKQ